MSSYEERAKKFIAKIYPYIKDCKSYWEFSLAVVRFNKECHRAVQIASGSTRIALITSDYVIKIDYNGWGKGTFGSCADEVRMYHQAVKEGYGHLLAKITPYRKQYNRTFYIMPRIKNIGTRPDDAEDYIKDENEYDWLLENIGDRHNHNYGWKDGHIIMIDYAYNSYTGYYW